MKNILTSEFEKMIYMINWLNKTILIRLCLVVDFRLNIDILKTYKNHELKYLITSSCIDNIELILDIIQEIIYIKEEKLVLNLVT